MAAVTVRYWAGAAAAAGRREDVVHADTVQDVLTHLRSRPELTNLVQSCSLLVDGQQTDLDSRLTAGAIIDVLPPFAGG